MEENTLHDNRPRLKQQLAEMQRKAGYSHVGYGIHEAEAKKILQPVAEATRRRQEAGE